jgi:hypothetical protein
MKLYKTTELSPPKTARSIAAMEFPKLGKSNKERKSSMKIKSEKNNASSGVFKKGASLQSAVL